MARSYAQLTALTERPDGEENVPDVLKQEALQIKVSSDAGNLSEEYDTDLEDDDVPRPRDRSPTGRTLYTATCARFALPPCQRALDQLDSPELSLKFRHLGPASIRPLAAGLVYNTRVSRLDLEENDLGATGARLICSALRDNKTLTHLDLSGNFLGGGGAVALGLLLRYNNSLMHLTLARNAFTDQDAAALAQGLEHNERVRHLDLSENEFSELGGQQLGTAIALNGTVEHLNLSWNQLRRKGAVSLCNGLKSNNSVSSLLLAWNALAYEGSVAVSRLLNHNVNLLRVDVSHNRINWEGAELVAQGLKFNDTLQQLEIGHNPLSTTGCLDLLTAVKRSRSQVRFISFEGIPVTRRVEEAVEAVRQLRPAFKIQHGGVMVGEDVLGRRAAARTDPVRLLIEFLSAKNIRPVELFRTFEKDEHNRVNRDQFIKGVKKAGITLGDRELEQVIDQLSRKSSDDKLSYQVLVTGLKAQIVREREREKARRAADQRRQDEHDRIINAAGGFPAPSAATDSPWMQLYKRLSSRPTTEARMLSSHSSIRAASGVRPEASQVKGDGQGDAPQYSQWAHRKHRGQGGDAGSAADGTRQGSSSERAGAHASFRAVVERIRAQQQQPTAGPHPVEQHKTSKT